jgi:hypothetical protein
MPTGRADVWTYQVRDFDDCGICRGLRVKVGVHIGVARSWYDVSAELTMTHRAAPNSDSHGNSSLFASSPASHRSAHHATSIPFSFAAITAPFRILSGSPKMHTPQVPERSSHACSITSSARLSWTTTTPGLG